MKTFLRNLEFNWDYYISYFLFNGRKQDRYFDYMSEKWGDRWYDHLK